MRFIVLVLKEENQLFRQKRLAKNKKATVRVKIKPGQWC